MMTNGEALNLYQRYVEGWKAVSDEQRRAVIEEVVDENVRYSTPQHASGGRQTIAADIEAFQQEFPEGRFDIGDVSAHHDTALLTWILIDSDGKELVRGHDQILVSSSGKIVGLTTFAPSAVVEL
jgi:predicted ester cyclase